MAYVVARRDARFEIRESRSTPRGPRSRTLATFRVLDDGVLDAAAHRAAGPFDRRALEARAVALGAPRDRRVPVRRARALLTDLRAGRPLPPAFADALREELGPGAREAPDTIAPLVDWLGATLAERGAALRDLLRLTDRLPPRRAPEGPRFPRLASSPG